MIGVYDYRLVTLSIAVSVLASYAALDLAGRIAPAARVARLAWLSGGAIAMGTGIWAMHYIGMEAFHLPVPVLYDWPLVVLSLLAAIVASGGALWIVSRPTMSFVQRGFGSIMMGMGISAMHYIGMAAMRLPARPIYSPAIVLLSIVLAIGIADIALRFAFALRETVDPWGWRKVGGALAMGIAIPVMHYVGMAAATFESAAPQQGDYMGHTVGVSSLGLACIVIATLVLLGLVCFTSAIDRHFALHARQLRHNELQLQTIFDNMTEASWSSTMNAT